MGMSNGRFRMKEDPGKGTGFLIAGIAALMLPGPGWLFSIGFFIAYRKRRKAKKGYERYLRYCSVIGSQERITVFELAKAGALPLHQTRQEIQQMIASGYFGERAYFDTYGDALVIPMKWYDRAAQNASGWLDSVVEIMNGLRDVRDAVRPQNNTAGQTQQEPIYTDFRTPQEEPAQEPSVKPSGKNSGAPSSKQEELEKVLQELYDLNAKIKDPGVSQRIDRIGELTAGIYGIVIEKPEREQDVHKFMTYYLPTTLKLLKSYDLMESQSYQGENIVASRKKIEGILDTLIEAFEKQLDHLFSNDAMDIAADVKVLETMIAGDGLSDRGRMRPSGGV